MFIAFLFVTSPSFWANIPTDSFVLTVIVPSLIPVEFLLASIPIFSLSVAVVEDNVIVPVFSALTFVLSTFFESFVTIIPTDFLLLTFILAVFINFKVDPAVVIAPSNNPNIPADSSALVVITAFVPSFFPTIFLLSSVNFT